MLAGVAVAIAVDGPDPPEESSSTAEPCADSSDEGPPCDGEGAEGGEAPDGDPAPGDGDCADGGSAEACEDKDGDGVLDRDDNCPDDANPDQDDADDDGEGDDCDSDSDGDGIEDPDDNCPDEANDDQADDDEDGLGDACDPHEDVCDSRKAIRDSDGDRRIVGTDGDDLICGDDSNETIEGLGGDDRIYGGEGDDTVEGKDGDDLLDGGAGRDRLAGGEGADTVDGGPGGRDLVVYDGGGKPVELSLEDNGPRDGRSSGGEGDDVRDTVEDVVITGPGRDHVVGNGRSNTISTRAGDDSLEGGAGDDLLRGEAGDDLLLGGEGRDELSGAAGADVLRSELDGVADVLSCGSDGRTPEPVDRAYFEALDTVRDDCERRELLSLPETTITSGPPEGGDVPVASFEFSSDDPAARFECRLDAGAWESCSSPETYPDLAEGAHSFAVRAIDAAGRADPTAATRAFSIDGGPPSVSIESPAGQKVGGVTSFVASAGDGNGVAKVEFLVDGAVRTTDATAPYAYNGSGRWDTGGEAPGAHEIAVRATDRVGKVASATANVTVDPASAPETGVIWRGDFDTGDLAQWQAVQEAAPDRVQVVDSPTYGGGHAGRFEVRKGDSVAAGDGNGNRAEVYARGRVSDSNSSWTDPEGSDRYYGWWTYIPADYPIDPRWQTITHWHAPTYGGSPVTVRIEGQELLFNWRPQRDFPETLWRAPLVRGRWHHFVMHAKWSPDPKVGFVEFWHDGELVVPKTHVANQYVRYKRVSGNMLKQGLYRSSGIEPNAVIYHDGTVMGNTYEDVAP